MQPKEELLIEECNNDFLNIVSESEDTKPRISSRYSSASTKNKINDEVDSTSNVKARKSLKRKIKRVRRVTTDSEEPQICPICGVMRINLNQHMICHSEEKLCKCDVCGTFVKTQATLRKHMIRVHTDYRPYKCDVCNVALKTANHLKRHMLTHSRDRNFTCSCCNKTFLAAATRDRHQWRHNAERNIKCQHCPKLFLTQEGLLNHVGRHTGELSFNCDFCPKAFVDSNAVSVHRRKHHKIDNFYHCGTCNMRYKNLKLLKIHIQADKHSLLPSTQIY